MTERRPYSLFIVRYAADVSTKSDKTRARLCRALARNIRTALDHAGVRSRLVQGRGRLFVLANDERRSEAQLKRVFGIGTVSRVKARCAADPEIMARTVAARFADEVEGRRYAVRVRRRGRHSFRSIDMERHLGAALNPYGTVHLDDPDVTVHAEILDDRAFFFTERVQGAGGLPVGTSGRVAVLLSGGFDSAVAAWRMMKRGLAVDFVFCNLAGAAYERQVIQVAKVLCEMWAFGTRPRLFVVDFAPLVAELKRRVEPRFWQVVLKRLMYRTASHVAARVKAGALVTGESIGQVSSQTLSNLRAIEPAAEHLVLRPLIGHDKREIMDEAKWIGTGPLCERIPEFCGLTDRPPAVKSSPAVIEAEEAKLDAGLLDRALKDGRRIALESLGAEEMRTDYLFVETVPEGAEVIDCQPPRHYAHWHIPGAVNYAPEEVIANLRRFDKRRCYVLYCSFGTQSAHLAEIMQQFGYQAYVLKGGIGAVRRRHEVFEPA